PVSAKDELLIKFQSNENIIVFSKKEMRDIFLSQFRTEDRRLTAEKGLIYPIKAIGSFINREIGDKKTMTKFFNEQIKHIKILLRTGVCVFDDIKEITLGKPDQDGLRTVCVSIEGHKEKEEVYTMYEGKLIPLLVRSSSDINRDHDNAISNVLKNLKPNEYPCLSIVSDACRNASTKNSTAIQESLEHLLTGKDIKEFANDLYKELGELFNQLSFTLMEGKANRKKSASI
ncbi:MAG: hypothetical protein K2J94_10930, partial [Duncaniella sp.]|nr:hypothetical protein [Duncaniella sp.]